MVCRSGVRRVQDGQTAGVERPQSAGYLGVTRAEGKLNPGGITQAKACYAAMNFRHTGTPEQARGTGQRDPATRLASRPEPRGIRAHNRSVPRSLGDICGLKLGRGHSRAQPRNVD
ncbi:hypothetical protein AAFF_G00132210 [Aldrovandia affinis]|uniref:Uncharacterized protein n=1 Tax=Aldrovandia affinis TaxID=143900 RepID=A0AAD7RQV1_9TELE|nr:hypothetical protein AAFF_G00132210 [Aldrovandia affinis]